MANETNDTRVGSIKNPKLQQIIRWTLLFLTCVATIFATTSLISCQLIVIKSDSGNFEGQLRGLDSFSFGYFQVAEYDSDGDFHHCGLYYKEFRDEDLGPGDQNFEAGKAFAILTMILLVLASIVFWAVMLFHFQHRFKLWNTLRVLLPLSFVTQCLALIVYGTELCEDASDADGVDDCVPDGAGVIQIINILFLFLASVLIFLVSAPEHPVFQVWGGGGSSPAPVAATKAHPGDHSHASEEEVDGNA